LGVYANGDYVRSILFNSISVPREWFWHLALEIWLQEGGWELISKFLNFFVNKTKDPFW